MALKMTLWLFTLLFIAAVWNAVTAYTSMGDVNVQMKFQRIGLLEGHSVQEFPLPVPKPLRLQDVASAH